MDSVTEIVVPPGDEHENAALMHQYLRFSGALKSGFQTVDHMAGWIDLTIVAYQ